MGYNFRRIFEDVIQRTDIFVGFSAVRLSWISLAEFKLQGFNCNLHVFFASYNCSIFEFYTCKGLYKREMFGDQASSHIVWWPNMLMLKWEAKRSKHVWSNTDQTIKGLDKREMFGEQTPSNTVWWPNMLTLKWVAKRLKHVWSNKDETIDTSRWTSVVRMPASNMFDTRLSKRTKHRPSNKRTKEMF